MQTLTFFSRNDKKKHCILSYGIIHHIYITAVSSKLFKVEALYGVCIVYVGERRGVSSPYAAILVFFFIYVKEFGLFCQGMRMQNLKKECKLYDS